MFLNLNVHFSIVLPALFSGSLLLASCGSGSTTAEDGLDSSIQGSSQAGQSGSDQNTPEPASGQSIPDAPAAAAPQNGTSIPTTIDLSTSGCEASQQEFKQALLQATNNSRATDRSCGGSIFAAAGALTWNDQLANAALTHSVDMGRNNFFDHTGSDGLSVESRITAEGYQYSSYGENIAAGQQTVESVQDGWMRSPGHCSNIMNSSFDEMGAACVSDANSDFGFYWTVVLGSRR